MPYPFSIYRIKQSALVLLLLSMNSAHAIEVKRFAWPEGTITYKVTGACTGTEILKWKDFGFRKAIYATNKLNLLGFSQETETLMVSNGATEYSINLKEKRGSQKTNKVLNDLYSSADRSQNISLSLLLEQGATEVGKKTILGMQCIEWQVKQGKSVETTCLTADGLPLEIESSVSGGSHHSMAVALNREPVSDDEVGLPKGITIQSEVGETNSIVKALKQTQQSKETLNCLAHDKPSVIEKAN